jgi:hypothetical protein
MSLVLGENATLGCSHSGKIKLGAGDSRLATGTTIPAATPATPGTWKVLGPGQGKLKAS